MKTPIEKEGVRSGGKALRRIRYFETQRGILHTAFGADALMQRDRAAAEGVLYGNAYEAREALISKATDRAQLPLWRALGPTFIPYGQTYGIGGNNVPPVSGRCVGIMISSEDRQHLILCSGEGGLWETKDQGKTWRPLTDQMPTLSMGAIAYAPSSPKIVYAGTGEGDTTSLLGLGLLRSDDGGENWRPVSGRDLWGHAIFDIAVDPANSERLWVGTIGTLGKRGRLFGSDNGGQNFTPVPDSATTWDISINPLNSQEIFAATAVGLIRSADGGKTWAMVPEVTTAESEFTRMEVCHAPSYPAIVYAAAVVNNQAILWRRDPSTGVFIIQNPTPLGDSDFAQAGYDFCVAVSPRNPDLIYWGAVSLYMGTLSTNGWDWQNISSRSSGDSIHGDEHHIDFDPSNPDVIYVCNDGGVFRSPNGGANWESLNKGLSIAEFEFLIQLESEDNWLIGGTQDNGTLGCGADGVWNQIALGDGGDCGVDDAKALCYHSYYGMPIERGPVSGPYAFYWDDVSPPVPKDYNALFYPPMDVSPQIVAKAGVTLFVSEDNGDHWEEVNFGGGRNASAVMIFSQKIIFVGTERGRLVRIERARTGWTNATVTALVSPVNGFISDIVTPGTPDKVIWVSCSAIDVVGHVFRSPDGGTNWEDCTGNMPVIPVNAIVVDPKNQERVFAATDHGVYQTQDAGKTWSDFSNGLPNAVVGDMIFHERRRLLRVGTRSRGAWEVNI